MNLGSSSKLTEKKAELIQEFDELLRSIDSSSTKEKILWRQIYENAITDRANANLCFLDLYPHLQNDVDNHMTHGMQAVQYLTRMEKSNEQLIKLAGMIQKALENQVEETLDSDALFQQIQYAHQEGEEK
jgi:hypothetical protein